MFSIFIIATLICMAVNAGILLLYGREIFLNVNVVTMAVPYFVIFLIISKDRISQIFFNFWLWVNIYAVIITFVNLINDLTFRNTLFVDTMVIILLFVFFVLYNKYLRTPHRYILETLDVNWWVFSLIPLCFEVLIVMSKLLIPVPDGYARNYPLLAVIFLLMGLIYSLLIYTFRKTDAVTRAEYTKEIQSQQLDAVKAQVSILNESHAKTAIYRHDMRHNLAAIDALLSTNNIQQAREYIRDVQTGIDSLTVRHYCENNMANLLISSRVDHAAGLGIRLEVDAVIPEELGISDVELCAILLNGLENALHAVAEMDSPHKWIRLYCGIRQGNLLIEIKNPYMGQINIQDGLPVTVREDHGYGCKSIRAVAQRHRGFSLFEAEDGVFILRVGLPLPR